MSFTLSKLIDTSTMPDPWNITVGDVYARPATMGWDRVVVLGFTPPTTRRALHDITQDVPVAEAVFFIDPFTHRHMNITAGAFRAWLTTYDMRPAGRMRLETPTP